jgi:D-amino peptidase
MVILTSGEVNEVKVFISADMEGVSGITNSDEIIYQNREEYERGRHLLTGDVNAAIQGAFDGGASHVVVNEAHWKMCNMLTEDVDLRAEVIRGKIKRGCMMEGLDENFDAVFFIGYHTKPGTYQGVMNHAFMGKEIWRILMNGVPVGEMEINAAYAGYFGVPIGMVSGDQVVCAEARETFGNIETVAVKHSIGRFTARLVHPETSRNQICLAACRSLQRLSALRTFDPGNPVSIIIDFTSSAMAEVCSWLPTVERLGPRQIEFTIEDWKKGMGLISSITWLARRVSDPVFC